MEPHAHYERLARIETPRLYLRPLALRDAEDIVRWRSDPESAALFLSAQPTLEEHLRWFRGLRLGRCDYVVVERATERSIGALNYKAIDERDGSCETGTLIGERASRGKGYAREAKVAWMLYGFACLGLRTVDVLMHEANEGIIRLNTALGYERVGSERHATALGDEATFVRMRLDVARVTRLAIYRELDLHGFLATIEARAASGAGEAGD